jgi:3-hydroxybutyryl-CoA dehydrogenase
VTAPERIAVVGAGLMGHGIAQVFACAGHPVAVYDPVREMRETLHARIAPHLRLLEIDDGPAGPLARVRACEDLSEALDGVGFVVEAAPEDVAFKQELIERITKLAAPDAVVASNSSSMPVAVYAVRALGRERVLGTHFWNPPYLIPLVEVVQGEQTSVASVERAMALLVGAGKLPVHVRKDVPGFVANRLQHALWREAIAIVQNGIADAETVDLCVRNSFGLRLAEMGPLETADLNGLDLVLGIHEQILPALDRTPGPLPILREKVAAGDLGMKSGRGFLPWTADSARAAHERLGEHIVRELAARRTAQPPDGADGPAPPTQPH